MSSPRISARARSRSPSAQSPATAPAETPAASAPSALRRFLVHGVRREIHIHLRLCRRVRAHRHGAEQKAPPNSFHAHPSPCPHAPYIHGFGESMLQSFSIHLFLVRNSAILSFAGMTSPSPPGRIAFCLQSEKNGGAFAAACERFNYSAGMKSGSSPVATTMPEM